jgi:hypothetical protein
MRLPSWPQVQPCSGYAVHQWLKYGKCNDGRSLLYTSSALSSSSVALSLVDGSQAGLQVDSRRAIT